MTVVRVKALTETLGFSAGVRKRAEQSCLPDVQ